MTDEQYERWVERYWLAQIDRDFDYFWAKCEDDSVIWAQFYGYCGA